jgi:2-keto-4-pentenoate hydratase/2-oxohepta-3-ene-1,7-dioic acid hydratase in catechol pathway
VRIARFAMGGDVAYGVVEEDQGGGIPPAPRPESHTGPSTAGTDRPLVIAELRGHPFGTDPAGVQFTGRRFPLADVRLLAPVLPSKVVAVGKNYAEHAQEMGCSSSRPPRWSARATPSPTRSS